VADLLQSKGNKQLEKKRIHREKKRRIEDEGESCPIGGQP